MARPSRWRWRSGPTHRRSRPTWSRPYGGPSGAPTGSNPGRSTCCPAAPCPGRPAASWPGPPAAPGSRAGSWPSPSPGPPAGRRARRRAEMVARDRVLAEALEALSALLGREAAPSDNLLELGLDSLTATIVVSRLGDVVGRDIPLRYAFDSDTVAEMVDLVL